MHVTPTALWCPIRTYQACVRYKRNILLVSFDRFLCNVTVCAVHYAVYYCQTLVVTIEVRSAIYLFLSEYLHRGLHDTEGKPV